MPCQRYAANPELPLSAFPEMMPCRPYENDEFAGRSETALRIFSALRHPVTRETLDHALVLYFKAPHSFTGEDVVEFQIHGSRAVVNSVLDALAAFSSFRLAEPGEYSKRAFYNGKWT